MKRVYCGVLTVTTPDDEVRAFGMVFTAPETADENAIIAQLQEHFSNHIKVVHDIHISELDTSAVQAIGLIALAKGLI